MKRARLVHALFLTLLASLLVPSAALASTSVGATPPPTATTAADCGANTGHVTRTSGATANPYIATASGVITEWQFKADATGIPGTLALQTLAADPNNNTIFTPLTESAFEFPAVGQLNRFKTRLPVSAGQFVGLWSVTASHGCYYLTSSGAFTDFGSLTPAPQPGSGPSMYGTATGSAATNVAATIEPDGDNDGFGDETQDGCPQNAQRSDDCVEPSVKIDKGPKKKTTKPKAKFKFSSDDPKATFECSADGKKFRACTSPFKLKKVRKGRHVFLVRATDDNGNTSTADPYKWNVKTKGKS
jgi:hypothetical protein